MRNTNDGFVRPLSKSEMADCLVFRSPASVVCDRPQLCLSWRNFVTSAVNQASSIFETVFVLGGLNRGLRHFV